MSIALRKKAISGGRYSLYLDHYSKGQRRKEYLELYLFARPKDQTEKQHNKQVGDLAKSILYKRQQAELAGDHGENVAFKKNVNFLEYATKWVDSYSKKDKKVVTAMFTYLKDFVGKDSIKPGQITENFCIEFKEYLESKLNGETPATYFARFKKLLKKAVRDKYFSFSPAEEVKNSVAETVKKDVLTFEEIQRLAQAHCGNSEVRRAFLFACYTGLRFADIKLLQWSNINSGELSFVQTKTDKKAPHKVRINLSPIALQILGEPAAATDKIFTLPSHTWVLKTLGNWTKRAGVQKHVTFHVARHSFATNLLYYQSDTMTVASLLGHTTTKHTQKYVRISDAMKQQAVNRLPEINMDKEK